MNIKTISILTLTGVLTLSMLAGCSSNTSSGNTAAS